MKLLQKVLLGLLVMGCGSSPTRYVPSPDSDKEGFSDKTIDQELKVASFKGSSATKKETAELYAKFRAIEVCEVLGRTYTHILVVKDRTYSKQVTQASTVTPTYYYGVSPYYGHYGPYGGGVGMGYTTASTTYSNEVYTYPFFEVYFECVDDPVDARISLKNISQAQMQTFVKDLKGGVQVDEVLSDSPNKGKLQNGDIIIMANGERIETVIEAYQAARRGMNKNLKVVFFRDGVKKEAAVSFKNVSKMVGDVQNEILKAACKDESIKPKKICKNI